MSWRTLLMVSTPRYVLDGVSDRGGELRVAVLRRDDQVSLDLALDRVAVRDAQALREHRDEGDERDPDHQRGRGRSGASGVALRVAVRELSGDAADPAGGDADDLRERDDQPRREHRDADEERQHADAEQREAVARGDVVGERAVRERDHGDRHDHAGDVGREAGEPAARQRRALAHGGDRRHAGGAHGREEPGEHRHERADEQRHDHRARGEDGRRLRQVEVEGHEELVQADGEPEAGEEPDDRGDEADHERLHDHGA